MIADPRLLQVAVSNGVIQARLRLDGTESGGLKAPLANAGTLEAKTHYWRVDEAPPPPLPPSFASDEEMRDHLEAAMAALPEPAFVWVEGADQLEPGDEGWFSSYRCRSTDGKT
jgi:hypothetical protein